MLTSSRVWTLQECVLSQRNICIWDQCAYGRPEFDLRHLLDAGALWSLAGGIWQGEGGQVDGIVTGPGDLWLMINHLAVAKYGYFDMLTFYRLARRRSASESRDQVFGLLGIMRKMYQWKTIPTLLRPDYEKPVDDVFRDATRQVLEHGGDRVLENIVHSSPLGLEMPSCPSWMVAWDTRTGGTQSLDMPKPVTAGKCKEMDVSSRKLAIQAPHGDPGLLTVEGFLLGAVIWDTPLTGLIHATALCPGGLHGPHGLAQVVDGLKVQMEARYASCTPLQKDEIVVELLTRGRWRGVYEDITAAAKALQQFVLFLKEHTPARSSLDATGSKIHQLVDRGYDRDASLFVLDDGHIGYGPIHTNKTMHQRALIMRGGTHAHIVQREADHFRYLGVAYLHDLMEGEVFELGIEPQLVCLR